MALRATAAAVAAASLAAACRSTHGVTYPWQDPSLPVPARVSNLISLLTVDEKVSLLAAGSPPVARIGLPGYNWAEECERGATSAPVGTSFPSGIALGSTWNASLVWAVAHATAIEVRATADTHAGFGASCFGPVINLIRDP